MLHYVLFDLNIMKLFIRCSLLMLKWMSTSFLCRLLQECRCFLLFISFFHEIFEQTKHGKINIVKLFPQQPNTENCFLPCFPWHNQTHSKHFPYRKIFSPEIILHSEIHLHSPKHSLSLK